MVSSPPAMMRSRQVSAASVSALFAVAACTLPAPAEPGVRVVFVARDGLALPDGMQTALHACVRFFPAGSTALWRDGQSLATGRVRLQAGSYDVCRAVTAGGETIVTLATCAIGTDTTELRVPVAITDRLLRLHLRGLAGDYTLRVVHESGRDVEAPARTDREHALLLPPGPCVVTVRRPNGDRHEQLERVLTITDAVEQDTTWDVTRANWRTVARPR